MIRSLMDEVFDIEAKAGVNDVAERLPRGCNGYSGNLFRLAIAFEKGTERLRKSLDCGYKIRLE